MDKDMKPLRLFYALWPDEATRDALMSVQDPLQGRKTRRENLHLTLAFLGRQPASLLPLLTDILTCIQSPPPILVLDRIGYFPKQRVTWAGTGESPTTLIQMQSGLVQALIKNGIEVEASKKYQPHLTLARDTPSPDQSDFAPITWCADHVTLVESVTNSDGAIYRVIASHSLTPG